MKSMFIENLGHSAMKITLEGYSILFDPYEDDSVPGLGPLRVEANQVISSHDHHDHNAVKNVSLDAEEKYCPFIVQTIQGFHDECEGKKRGTNRISILTSDDFAIAHLGDIGCMPKEKDIESLEDLDAVMIPVGGYYTMEPNECWELVSRIKPRVIIPMHYRGPGFGYDVIKEVKAFVEVARNKGYSGDVCFYEDGKLELTEKTKPQISILKFR